MQLPFSEEEWKVDSPKPNQTGVLRGNRELGRTASHAGWVQERALTSDLMEAIAPLKNLTAAGQPVVSNRRSSGIDGMSVAGLKSWKAGQYEALSASLLRGDY